MHALKNKRVSHLGLANLNATEYNIIINAKGNAGLIIQHWHFLVPQTWLRMVD